MVKILTKGQKNTPQAKLTCGVGKENETIMKPWFWLLLLYQQLF
jgi:hypothetical protein